MALGMGMACELQSASAVSAAKRACIASVAGSCGVWLVKVDPNRRV